VDVILITAITQDGFIARHANEGVTWSEDLYLFKKQTLGWPVIMGSNTHDCLQTELEGRDIIVIHRNDDPGKVLAGINSEKCFIAGGGKTNARFSSFLTHLYLTPHPVLFGGGIPLFSDTIDEMGLTFEKMIPVNKNKGIFQFQYRTNCKIN
jgi:dihydrofolate reductase|tara:strand:- start:1621 stop:2076 length:456 start_codon:yes stop_codon:yes gene_type:complete